MTEPTHQAIEALAAARAEVRSRIDAACRRAGRDPAAVTLIAVSKTVSADRLRMAVAAGLTQFGENRVQEAVAKAEDVPGATWHLVGPLQSNKARRAVELFTSIQTVDSVDLAERLDRLVDEVRPGTRYPVLLQVNVDLDPAKAGFQPDALPTVIPTILGLERLEVAGLMTVGRFTDDPVEARATFRALRTLSEAIRGAGSGIGTELSMGMSDDYEIAAEEGATIVRVGRAIFGDRPHRHDHSSLERQMRPSIGGDC